MPGNRPLSEQQINAAHGSLEQGKLPDEVSESQRDQMSQLIINWVRTNITKAKESDHGDPMLNLLVNIAANRIELLERIKETNKELLKAIVTLMSHDGETPLSQSVRLNCGRGIDWFINNGADINWRLPRNPNYTLLHLAAECNAIGYFHRLKAVYKDKADEFRQTLDLPDDDGYSPLALAVRDNNVEAINCLIDYGADTNWRNSVGYNLFSLAADYNAIDALECLKVKVYKNRNAEFKQAINLIDDHGNVPLVQAVRDDYDKAIDWLIKNGADLNWRRHGDPNYTLFHEAATCAAVKTLGRLKAAYKDKDAEFKQVINLKDENRNTLLTLAVLGEQIGDSGDCNQDETVDWFIDNCFFSCSASEIDSVVTYFKDWFHDLIGRQKVKDERLCHQSDFEKYFNSLLKYAGICHASSPYLPDFFKDLYEIARSYAILKYPQVYYSPLPGELPLFPLASVLVELVDPKSFPVEYLHTYLQTRKNINWEIFVAKVAGIEIEAGANDEVIAKLAKQHTYNNIFGKMADEIALAIFKGVKKTWIGISEEYQRDIRECLFELLIEKNSRIVGMNPNINVSSKLFVVNNPYYISPLALKAITEELVELTNQRNSPHLKNIEIRAVVSKYIVCLNSSTQTNKNKVGIEARVDSNDDADVDPTSAKKRKLDSPDEQKPNPELQQPSIPSTSSTASTSSNKRKAEPELQRSDNNDDDDENPAAAKKPKSNASGEQERNINPEQEQPSTQTAAKNNNNDDGPLSTVPCGLS